MSSRLSKVRSVHTYVMHRTVYFGWICTYLKNFTWMSMFHAVVFALFKSASRTFSSCPLIYQTFLSTITFMTHKILSFFNSSSEKKDWIPLATWTVGLFFTFHASRFTFRNETQNIEKQVNMQVATRIQPEKCSAWKTRNCAIMRISQFCCFITTNNTFGLCHGDK